MKLKQFIRDSNEGFTLVELLVTLVIASIVLGLSLSLIVQQRKLFVEDKARTQVNQNLRVIADIVGTDIKQAGERLVGNTQLPVVRVIDGGGPVGAPLPDQLILQRKVIDQILPVCQTITAGTTQSTIDVSVKGGTGDCTFSDGNLATWSPDNLEEWQDARCSKDNNTVCNRTANVANDSCAEQAESATDRECLWAYIYNPGTNKGEFFLYSFEAPRDNPDTVTNRYRIYRAPSATASKNIWLNTYTYNPATPASNPLLYILEERSYSLVDNPNLVGDKILRLVLNRQTTPITLVNQLKNFQVQVVTLGATPTSPDLMPNAFNPTIDIFNPTETITNNWQQIKSINITFKPNLPPGSIQNNNLDLSAKFFPRNAGSR